MEPDEREDIIKVQVMMSQLHFIFLKHYLMLLVLTLLGVGSIHLKCNLSNPLVRVTGAGEA